MKKLIAIGIVIALTVLTVLPIYAGGDSGWGLGQFNLSCYGAASAHVASWQKVDTQLRLYVFVSLSKYWYVNRGFARTSLRTSGEETLGNIILMEYIDKTGWGSYYESDSARVYVTDNYPEIWMEGTVFTAIGIPVDHDIKFVRLR